MGKGRRTTDLGTLSDVVLCEDFAGLVRVTDVLERLCCVAADLAEEDFVATGVLYRAPRDACVS